MRGIGLIAVAMFVVSVQTVLGQPQKPMSPTAPGTSGDPAWQGIVRLSDGRTLVTDGGMAIDVALAKPAKLPERVLATTVLEKYLNAEHKDEYGFFQLTGLPTGRTYTTPSGIALSSTYINYLRRILPTSSLRFRMTAELDPVVIVSGGKAVGVLMPVRSAKN